MYSENVVVVGLTRATARGGDAVILDGTSLSGIANPRIDLLLARADAEECDVIARVRAGSIEVGFVYSGGGEFTPRIRDHALRRLGVLLGGITYTAVPPGHGFRGRSRS